jgi:hypothetical protein
MLILSNAFIDFMVESRGYASPCLSFRASSGSIRAMDMREIMMIIGDDEPVGQMITASGPVWLWRAEPPAKGSWHFLTITGNPKRSGWAQRRLGFSPRDRNDWRDELANLAIPQQATRRLYAALEGRCA